MKFSVTAILLFLSTAYTQAQYAPEAPPANGVMGYWSTDVGSVLRVAPCGQAVCITIMTISPKAPGILDTMNPDPALRNRSVCHIDIGTDLKLKDPDYAVDGKIYDPMSGKTYDAEISSSGNTLNLRGYIGIKAFGRSETWKRTTAAYATCVGTTHR